jgi:class 3 adenylate cyclase
MRNRQADEEKDHQDHQETSSDEDMDFSNVRPVQRLAGNRTVSTSARLQRQGLSISKNGGSNFAVKSIRRGSDEWRTLIKPFVSDLAFRSLFRHRIESEISCRPYTCHAAVLFVDLSGYSRIAAAIAHKGAHALSSVVNKYLSMILTIVNKHGGDVVKFAGDAVLVVWEGEEKDLEINVLCAAQCVIELQEEAGSFPVEGTELVFKIHCGVCCGPVESEVFQAPTHAHMQRLYHAVGGDALAEISELVDLAKAGETCISEECVEYLGDRGSYKDVSVPGFDEGAMLLTALRIEDSLSEDIEEHIQTSMIDRMERRNMAVEEDFVCSSVLKLLSHGGLSPTHIAQMRNLCVLFIAMTSHGSSVNWLMEVQAVLDKNWCPIVQIIDDDKGVHIVAAINLYSAIPETAILGIEVCRELVQKQVGCAIGMAIGSTFCGVTGSSSVACRWDITGPPPVRAARLMQYAVANNLEVAIDQSVYQDPVASPRMDLVNSCVNIKGTLTAVPVYTLSSAVESAALRVLETVHGRMHNGAVAEVQEHITGYRNRCAVVVTGPPLAGKKIVCQRAAGFADMVPFLHVCSEAAGSLQLARTMVTWFKYIDNDEVRDLARVVIGHMDQRRWSRAHDECTRLVNLAIETGFSACFVVDRIQLLDEFSLSLIRECLHGISRVNRLSSRVLNTDFSEHSSSTANASGRICFLCVHVSLYSGKSAAWVVEDITRSHKRLHVPIVKVGEASMEEFRSLFRDLSDMEVEERWLNTYAKSSGYCAGYFVERAASVRKRAGKQWSEGKRAFAETSADLVLRIPQGFIRKNTEIPVMQISADVAMRFTQIYDELPPLFQTLLKALAIATRKSFFKLPRKVLWEVLNDLIAEGVEVDAFDIVIKEMLEMFLLKIGQEDGEEVVIFQSPALADVALDVCTPIQVYSITKALIERLEPNTSKNFKIPFVLARFYHFLGEQESMKKQLWRQGYEAFLRESKSWPEEDVSTWKELIESEIEDAGYAAPDILGKDFSYPFVHRTAIDHRIPLVKIYHAPISFGPMGHSLSVICRNTFHEYAVFHGMPEEAAKKLRKSTESAFQRYTKEISLVEEYLKENGFGATPDDLEEEISMLEFFARPAEHDNDVVTKAEWILDEYVTRIVEHRLQRLRSLVAKLRREDLPAIFDDAPKALRYAYVALQFALQGGLCPIGCPKSNSVPEMYRSKIAKVKSDAAQDALMILATLNWKPRPVPEKLPLLYYTTVSRIRNKVLKRLTESELIIFRHQHTVDDLEVFLVVTALLYGAQDRGEC